ncbi:MAG: LemA family protein [Chitinophagaceae bacterium]
MPVIILLVIFGIIIFLLIRTYNKLRMLRRQRTIAFANINTLLQQRHVLISQLVETVKNQQGYERNLLQKVTEARSAAVSATTIEDKIKSEQLLTASLRNMNASLITHSDLQTNQAFQKIREELDTIEGTILSLRDTFNTATTTYNNALEKFPNNLIASNFDFIKEPVIEFGAEKLIEIDESPKVSI